jgi:hypothetical protein
MGERRAVRESIVGNLADDVCWTKDNHVPFTDNIVCLHNFFADKLYMFKLTLFVITNASLALSLRQL